MEYKIIKVEAKGLLGTNVSKHTEALLNEYGQAGWRLVAVVPVVGVRMTFVSSTIAYLYHFERSIK